MLLNRLCRGVYLLPLCLFVFLTIPLSGWSQCSISGETTVCENQVYEYQLTGQPVGTASVVWNVPNGSLIDYNNSTAHVQWTAPGTVQITVSFYTSSGSPIFAQPCPLTVNITEEADLEMVIADLNNCGYDGEAPIVGLCMNDRISFSVPGVTGTATYFWTVSGSASIPDQTSPNPIIIFTAPGAAEVCVLITYGNNCTETLCETIQVYGPPVTNFSVVGETAGPGSVLEVCLNESLTFIGTVGNLGILNIGEATWTVNGPGGLAASGSGLTFSYTFSQPGTYVVTFEATNCLGCSSSQSMTVEVREAAGPEIVCPSLVCQSNDPVEYCAPADCTSPNWSTNGTPGPASSSGNCINVIWDNPPANGYGTVTLQCDNYDCPLPTTVEIPIIPQSPEILGPTSLCDNNSSGVLYELPLWPNADYTWSILPAGLPVTGGPATGSNRFFVNLNGYSGTFTIQATVNHTIAGCESTSQLTVNVTDYILSGPTEICAEYDAPSESPAFQIDPAPPSGFNVVWTIYNNSNSWTYTGAPDDRGLEASDPGTNGLPFNEVFGGSGLFFVTAQIVYPGNPYNCQPLQTTIDVLPTAPAIEEVIGRRNVCPNVAYTYVANPPAAGVTYEWIASNGTTNGSTTGTVQVTWGSTGPYSLQVRRCINDCCSDWFVVDNIQAISADVSGLQILGPSPVCTQQLVQYSASSDDFDNFQWTIVGGSGNIVGPNDQPTVSVIWNDNSNPAKLRLRVRLCGTSYNVTRDIILNDPDATFVGESVVCQFGTGLYSVTPTGGGTYTWYVNGVNQNLNQPSITPVFETAGQNTVQVSVDGYGGCPGSWSDNITVNVIPNPAPSITQTNGLCCREGGTTSLIAAVLGGTIVDETYQWYHFESGNWAPVEYSNYDAFYYAHGSILDINAIPTAIQEIIGLFKVEITRSVVIEGRTFSCTNSAEYNLTCGLCVPVPGCDDVRITNWEYFVDPEQGNSCGAIKVTGAIPEDEFPNLITSYFEVIEHPSGVDPNPITPADIYYPEAVISTFEQPGVYHLRLVAVFSAGHGTTRTCFTEITIIIPFVPDFSLTYTCSNTDGYFDVNIQNLTSIIEYPEGTDIQWTWLLDGDPFDYSAQPPSIQLEAGSTHRICVRPRAVLKVFNGQEEVEMVYECEYCQDITLPADRGIMITGPLAPVCAPASVTFSSTLTGLGPNIPILSYQWTITDPSGLINTSTLATPTITFTTGGTATVQLTVVLATGCTASATYTLPVNSPDLGALLTQTPTGCNEIILSVSTTVPCVACPFTYAWAPVAGSAETLTVTQSGVYRVTVTDSGTGCSATASSAVIISNPFPSGLEGDLEYCDGDATSAVISLVTESGYTYTFTGAGLSATSTGINPRVYTITWTGPGIYPFTITAFRNGQACGSITDALVIHPAPGPITIATQYSCDPFQAVLTANQSVTWLNTSGATIGSGTSISVNQGGTYAAVAQSEFGCTSRVFTAVQNAPSAYILTGCYCIEREVVGNGLAVLQGPGGSYTHWEWVNNGSVILSGSGTVDDLPLSITTPGVIILRIRQNYTNSDGSITTCNVESEPFDWNYGPCDIVQDSCNVPEPTTRTIHCIAEGETSTEYYVHWDFPVDGLVRPCYTTPPSVLLGSTTSSVGSFNIINHEQLGNAYWHFEGTFTVDHPYDPFDICWEIPFCDIETGQQCGVSRVCPDSGNPQHNDDILLDCPEHPCDNVRAVISNIECDHDPFNNVTHTISVTVSASVPATPNTMGCPNFAIYLTSVTGTLPNVSQGWVENINAPAVNGMHDIQTTITFDWYDQIGTDIPCFSILVKHDPDCYRNDGDICSIRFCEDQTNLDCEGSKGEESDYVFLARCREDEDGTPIYDYSIRFLNITSISSYSFFGSNIFGTNTVTGISANQLTGTYKPNSGVFFFKENILINGTIRYAVEELLPYCWFEGGEQERSNAVEKRQMPTDYPAFTLAPNPASDFIRINFGVPEKNRQDRFSLRITNALGMPVLTHDLISEQTSALISLDNFSNGWYQVSLLQNGRPIQTQKIVVLKSW